jgi:hypothetical protein
MGMGEGGERSPLGVAFFALSEIITDIFTLVSLFPFIASSFSISSSVTAQI